VRQQRVRGRSQRDSVRRLSQAILCCPGNVIHRVCNTLVFYGSNTAEPGAIDDPGDWDRGFTNGTCGPGRYVAGVSRFLAPSGAAMNGAAHAIYCCAP
jgi:hypothetical protein